MYFEMMLTDLCSASCYVQGDITPFPLLQFHHQPIGIAINKTNDMHYISDTLNNRIQRFHSNLFTDF